jgi:phosphoribosylaminoimidazolecarboxamide formyltransferase/IMP cyclohydrolase
MAAVAEHEIPLFDLVVINLYPFEKTVEAGARHAEAIETIDVGGPAMIRAAAKNHAYTAVVVDPEDYPAVIAALSAEGATSLALRRRLAGRAFARTAAYDAAIAAWFASETGTHRKGNGDDRPKEDGSGHGPEAPAWKTVSGRLVLPLRYGENPHQYAGFYAGGLRRPGVATATLVQGKALSYNNINDTDAAYELAAEFDPARTAACVIVKHANPCGVAEAPTLVEAYRKALKCDPVSAFGGIVALNRPLDGPAAREIVRIFTEVVIAPDADDEARAVMAGKPNLRLLLADGLPDPAAPGEMVRSVAGGFLVQSRDDRVADGIEMRVVTRRAPTDREWADLRFAWRVVKHVKSNAIVYARDLATAGIGAGQMSRVDAARIATRKAEDAASLAGESTSLATGSVAASDAFFPFADGLLAIVEAGATAVVQPGGSVRDEEVIRAADLARVAMVFTGTRHFRH